MASTTKKGSKNTKAKPRRAAVKSPPAKQVQTNAELRQQLAESFRRENATAKELTEHKSQLAEALQQQAATANELREALEHQTATSEVLGIISRSPTDVQRVLDSIVESAAKVCGIDDVVLRLRDGNFMVARAHIGPVPVSAARMAINIDEPQHRWIREHGTLHIPDVRDQSDSPLDTPKSMPATGSYRTFLSAPLRQRGDVIGILNARRSEVRPFTAAQIKLLETFADQAVIAIENVRLFQELTEALEQQTTTSEILRVISSSPTDLQPVMDTIAESATRLCDANDARIRLIDGNIMRLVTTQVFPVNEAAVQLFGAAEIRRDLVAGRAILDRQTLHIHDLAVAATEFPASESFQKHSGTRTILAVPLLREETPIGVIVLRRTETRPFTEKQIALVKTFADQAVIAIENARLFKELQERNAELREALEHQTATSEVLGIISRSPTDVQPVLDAIVESAARVCGIDDVVLRLHEGNSAVTRAHFGPIPIGRVEISCDDPRFHWMREHGTLHIPDVLDQNDFPMLGSSGRWRTFLAAPLRQQSEVIGSLGARRIEARPFTPAQIKLLETFASQAVIALENVRLFQELKESLEQQTATSEILGVIASSPTDIQPVLDVVAQNAARLCEANDARIMRVDGEMLRPVAHYGPLPDPPHGDGTTISRGWPSGRAIVDRQTIHVHDFEAVIETEFPESKDRQSVTGVRTILVTPLFREGVPIGVIVIRRKEVRPFTDKHIALIKTFADQAVIAIENVRLFKELQERNAELREALEHQTATSEVLSIISRSPTDVQPVLDAIVESAARVCGIDDVVLRLVEGDMMAARAHFGPIRIRTDAVSTDDPRVVWIREHGTLHVPDVHAQNDFPATRSVTHYRTHLAVPLRQQEELIGALVARRSEVRPFTPAQIKLLETFADQAVIAIENVRLFKELQERNRDLIEALEQQTATSEILSAIAGSPTDLQPVLDTVIANAVRLVSAKQGHIRQVDGEYLRLSAHYNESDENIASFRARPVQVSSEGFVGRVLRDKQPIHVPDVQQEAPERYVMGRQSGARTMLAVPLLREGVGVGTILIWRDYVEPFTDRQIEFVKTFADQAVIAIENVRLFKELQERNAELREALEHQTATSEVLSIISRSPTDVQPVLDAIVESAAKVCGIDDVSLRLREENNMVMRAHTGPIVSSRVEISLDMPHVRWLCEHGTLHVPDARAAQDDFPTLGSVSGFRSFMGTPLRQRGQVIGILTGRRAEVCPFTPAQIKLLETFADQAVIAIENVRLFKELQERNRDLTEALEQQTATSEILGIIASSPTDIQPVLDTVAQNAARLCDANDAVIHRLHGTVLRVEASFGPIPTIGRGEDIPVSPATVHGRAITNRQTIHVHDLAAEVDTEFTDAKIHQQRHGTRTILATPLLREGVPVGLILIRRLEVRPFSEKQIALLETFASQAVIAIENVRLFKELQERNAELREALEHQTATAEVLGIISRSPTDVQPVLDAIVESAAKVCGIDDVVLGLREGDVVVARAHVGPVSIASGRVELNIDTPHFRWIREHGTLHVPDTRAAQDDFSVFGVASGFRSFLGAPLRLQGEFIGLLIARRTEVRPFTLAQIKLLETFADQAVIALENVRLFQELRESLEQQTATSEILSVIASSPTDVQPVLDVVAENAAQLCDATDAVIHRLEGDELRSVANYGPLPGWRGDGRPSLDRRSIPGRTVIDGRTLHIHDLAIISEDDLLARFARSLGVRSVLATPLLREGIPIGTIHIRRMEVRPFTEKQIKLLETFASQAVIAIENVRLFKELGERNAELREALEHQTATSEVLGIISRSPTDVQPVLDAIVESAAKVCGIDDLGLRLREGNTMVPRAHFGPIPVGPVRSFDEPQVRWIREHGTLHVPDVRAQNDFPTLGSGAEFRTFLSVPLRQAEDIVGLLNARRTEVRPFTPAQIKLLETFADQAVIAIENVRLFQELKESLEQQTATSEILGVIASSPTDIQPVLDVVAENAARLCEATDAVIHRIDGDKIRVVANYGPLPGRGERGGLVPVDRDTIPGRAIIDRRTLRIDDLAAVPEDDLLAGFARRVGVRTVLATPLLREGIPIGTIHIRRMEVRPFTEKQIKLLETFAAQAVIAIENVRLFRELKESLEQQTATSEILGVIASSPTDIQPVLDVVAKNAARLGGAADAQIRLVEGDGTRLFASYGSNPAPAFMSLNSPASRAVHQRKQIHFDDLRATIEAEMPNHLNFSARSGTRTFLSTPMLREGTPIGLINVRRTEVRPFSENQMALLRTFAAQAVIAIENVRLFKELDERTNELTRSVGELKALGEVGQAVSSTLDLETVLTRIVSHAVQLSGTDGGAIYEYDEPSEEFQLRATDHMEEELITALRNNPPRLGDGVVGRAAVNREPVVVPNILEERAYAPRMRQILERFGFRASLAVPLLREDRIVGGLVVRRKSVGEFRPEVIELLKTFATQSVLAIQNARLFVGSPGTELEFAL